MGSMNRSSPARPPLTTSQAGIAMITTLLVTTVAFILVVSLAVVAFTESRSTRSSVQSERALQLADAGTEWGRIQLIEEFDDTYLSVGNFLQALANDSLPNVSGINAVDVGGQTVHWEVRGVSDPTAPFGWIDVAATSSVGEAVQTVVRRVGFGASSTFNLAILSETTDCMFCHLRVNGDVGNLVFMRPGWGEEGGSGKGSGGSLSGLGESRINGNVFAAQDVTGDGRAGGKLNGATVTGLIEENSVNGALPADLDGDGVPDFPPIDRDVAVLNATGTISGGTSGCVIPIGGTFSGACGVQALTSVTDGNLILEGTEDNPIVIDGDVWIEGDVIIKGYVKGIGGLYSGRNVYIAGDLVSVDPPYSVDSDSGSCRDSTGATIMTAAQMAQTGFSPNDACARRSIADGTDELRIGARGGIIIGDYAETDVDGEPLSFAGQQSAQYYRSQFGLYGNTSFDSRNGDELRCVSGVCRNADNQVVSSANVRTADFYDGVIRPGMVDAGGFSSWIRDDQYQEILGTETFDYNTWRWTLSGTDLTGAGLAESLHGLVSSGFDLDVALEILDRRVNFGGMSDTNFTAFRTRAATYGYSIGADKAAYEHHSGSSNGRYQTVDDEGNVAVYNWNGSDLRVLFVGEREYETQVNRIDAFLYSNQRIAGKTSMQAMSVNGGLITRDLGILAPGRVLEDWTFGSAMYNVLNNQRATACSDPTSDYYVYGTEDCALTVNYDHRLRNGGYGYNIIEGALGATLDWRIADSPLDRVAP